MIAIVAPMHCRALAGARLLAFVFCLRDETAILYYPPGGETLPVRIPESFRAASNNASRSLARS